MSSIQPSKPKLPNQWKCNIYSFPLIGDTHEALISFPYLANQGVWGNLFVKKNPTPQSRVRNEVRNRSRHYSFPKFCNVFYNPSPQHYYKKAFRGSHFPPPIVGIGGSLSIRGSFLKPPLFPLPLKVQHFWGQFLKKYEFPPKVRFWGWFQTTSNRSFWRRFQTAPKK